MYRCYNITFSYVSELVEHCFLSDILTRQPPEYKQQEPYSHPPYNIVPPRSSFQEEPLWLFASNRKSEVSTERSPLFYICRGSASASMAASLPN
jgi:hypothetical protein